jgi:hypothetical protein
VERGGRKDFGVSPLLSFVASLHSSLSVISLFALFISVFQFLSLLESRLTLNLSFFFSLFYLSHAHNQSRFVSISVQCDMGAEEEEGNEDY